MKTTLTLIILILVSVITQFIFFLTWWAFLLPIFLLGVILPLEKWKIISFPTGFIAGFAVWIISTLYFEIMYNGEIVKKIGTMFNIPGSLMYIIVGCIGGCLTGLAFYSGYLLRVGKENIQLQLPEK